MTPQERTWLRFPRDVVAYLGMSRSQVLRYRESFPLRKRGRILWVRREAVDRFVEGGMRA